MKFIRASHVTVYDRKQITFGIDQNGDVWIVTNSDKDETETDYFGLSPYQFADLIHYLVSFAFAAMRVRLTGSQYPPTKPDE